MLNLDTHILLFALSDGLSPRERKLLSGDTWSISDIVLWEITKLSQLGRITLDIDDPDFFRAIAQVHIWPLSLEVCRSIGKLDIKSDPADEIIAATSLAFHVPLVTRDKKILKSKVVPFAG
jgi:PIN domain nuclease of toxin-antitoxin system